MTEASIAAQAWSIALEFLNEAERISASATPRMAIHAAYYAMFHAARAVLLKVEGLNAPTKHNAVVSRFGYHAKSAHDSGLMDAGRALNIAQQERLRSDYSAQSRPQPAQATAAVAAARNFLEACARAHGFPTP